MASVALPDDSDATRCGQIGCVDREQREAIECTSDVANNGLLYAALAARHKIIA